MAIVWAESFDLYGTGATGMTELQKRGVSAVGTTGGTGIDLRSDTSIARTGNGYVQVITTANNDGYVYRLLDASQTTVGQGIGFMATQVPATNTLQAEQGIRFGTASSIPAGVNVVVNSDLGFSAYVGTTLIGQSLPNQINVGVWYWLEAKVICGTGSAYLEVRLNGVMILQVSGFTFAGPMQRIGFGKLATGTTKITARYDDWVIWDATGTQNNDFIGERRCVTSYPNANGTPQDWTASTGSQWSCIDESVPADTDYIEAAAVGNISEFTKQPIGVSTTDVAAVVVIARGLKSDAGTSEIRLGVHSGSFVQNSATKALSTAASYFNYICESDPNGSVPWTRTAVDAATMRFERTA